MRKRVLFSVLIIFALALLLIIPNSFAVEEGLTGDQIITIEDEKMKDALLRTIVNYDTKEKLDANEDGEISVNEILRLTSLSISGKLPDDLSALNYATSLKFLYIGGMEPLENISALETLSNKEIIEILNIYAYGNTTSEVDMGIISKFVNVKNLTIAGANISNIDELSKLKNLVKLSLTRTNIVDATVLGNLEKLETLTLTKSGVKNISPLNNCVNLKEVYLDENKIEEIPNFSALTKVEKFQVTQNPLKDASGLNSLKSLKTIYIGQTDLKTVELRDLPNLELFNINISNGEEKNITLENLTSLKEVQCASAKVKEINITNCPNVEIVNAAGNNIQDISFLKDLSKLKEVNISSNPFAQDNKVNAEVLADLDTRGVTVKKDPYYDKVGPVYELNAEETGYIVKDFFGMNETEVTIPATYEGKPVVEIGDDAFYRPYADYNLEKIVLPETITKIGNRAFSECQKLTSVNIPKGVTSIGEEAFEDCKLLTNIELPENITVIPYGLFWGCSSLKNVIIPEGVINIEGMAFYGCTSFTEMVVPDSVKNLGNSNESGTGYTGGVFSGCTNLKKVTLSKNITKIDHNTFASCNSLETLTVPEGVIEIDACGLWKCTAMKKLVLPRTFNMLEEAEILEIAGFNPVVYGYKGTKAEELATLYELEFVALDETLVTDEKIEIADVNGAEVTILPLEEKTGLDYVNESNFPAINAEEYEVKILDKNGNEKDSKEKLGSRSVIKITDELGNIFAEITIVVSGDVTGNGEARMYDAFQILKDTIIPGVELDGIDVKIRDYTGDGNVRMYDAFQFLKDSILN